MAKYDYLGLDGAEHFAHRADILNDVFDYQIEGGGNIKLARRSVYQIAPNKKVWFPHLAVIDKENGGWKTPKNISWFNIPSPDQRIITEIPIKGNETQKGEDPVLGASYAVFVCEETNPPEEKYRFYGIFKPTENDERDITIWKRENTVLVCAEWKAKNEQGA